ncbi:hypothetical protein BU14_0200s0014 [Porphyra umbilicalis]|uniref:ASPIC/UnbV domain-containing protein n=1 Tax=Porphyra umbilicalis TaxID=2786 RepID=A0A1X6P698_PORUM|nr:hypothetical protein BU14_0200s0014 [Porphyra umbilicalis]|eukprot:OSX76260.1 hypothetical protein BU14_0200s0014 [Porphyra umbilicalis]
MSASPPTFTMGASPRRGCFASLAAAAPALTLAATALVCAAAVAAAAGPPSRRVFTDVTDAAGLAAPPGLKYGGPVVADLNADGVYDLVLPQHHLDPTAVFWGRPSGVYTRGADLFPFNLDVHGVAVGDVDLDGDADVVVSIGGAMGVAPTAPVLLRNVNGMAFVNASAKAGFGGRGGRGRSPRFIDLNGDGRLDLVVLHYRVMRRPGPRQHVYENRGRGTFVPRYGTGLEGGIGEQLLLTDMDGDGRTDIVSFPFFRLYRQVGPFRFVDNTNTRLGNAATLFWRLFPTSWVVELDVERDGLPDLYVVCMNKPDVLLRNVGGRYVDGTVAAGLGGGSAASTGATAGDFDNDGHVDLLVFRGAPRGRPAAKRLADVLYWNLGNGTFAAATNHGASPPAGVVAAGGAVSDAGQAFDADGDGRLDVLVGYGDRHVAARAGRWRLYRNILPVASRGRGNWLTVRVLRSWPRTASAAGATVTVVAGGVTHVRRVGPAGASNHQGQLSLVHFGLGSAAVAEVVSVRWSDGFTSKRRRGVAAGRMLTIGR